MTALPEGLAASFRDRRVLITGGLGFIGSNLARELVELGRRVTIVDSLVPEYGGLAVQHRGHRGPADGATISDVRDEHSLRFLVRDQDVLFNLAGQTSHLDSMTDPYTDLEINAAPALDPRSLPARQPRRHGRVRRARARSTDGRDTCRSTRATRSRRST